ELLEWHPTELGDVLAAELDGQRLWPKTPALAGGARARHQEATDLVVADSALVLVEVIGVIGRRSVLGTLEPLLESGHDPRVALLGGTAAAPWLAWGSVSPHQDRV